MRLLIAVLIGFATSVALLDCASSKDQLLASSESQVKLRSIQTRAFDTSDQEKTLRTVMATLQDLGFVIDEASALWIGVNSQRVA